LAIEFLEKTPQLGTFRELDFERSPTKPKIAQCVPEKSLTEAKNEQYGPEKHCSQSQSWTTLP